MIKIMKNCFKTLVVLLAICVISTGSYAQKQKFGHINSSELLKLMPDRDSAVAKINDYAKTLQDQLQGMQEEYDSKTKDFTANQVTMTEIIKKTKTKEIQDLQSRMDAFTTSAREDIQKKQDELLKPIIDRAKAAIEKVSKANGYTYIFDSGLGVLLYTDPTDDILPLVKKEMGLK
jgi:outer membrane protein